MTFLCCQRCHLRTDLCLCGSAPQLSSCSDALQLVLLTHPQEPQKRSNTGRLLEASLSSCEIWMWERRDIDQRLVEYSQQNSVQPVLLFPATDEEESQAVCLSPNEIRLDQNCFILLDATWQQARKMLRQSTVLKECARLSLQPSAPSLFNLRRNQREGSVSSVETGIQLLRGCGLEADANQLEHYFRRFLHHSEAHRSGYTLDGLQR